MLLAPVMLRVNDQLLACPGNNAGHRMGVFQLGVYMWGATCMTHTLKHSPNTSTTMHKSATNQKFDLFDL